MFPDLVLTDANAQVYVEVWGVTGRRLNDIRKWTKRAYHQQTSKVGLLEWDVGSPLPPVTRGPAARAVRGPRGDPHPVGLT